MTFYANTHDYLLIRLVGPALDERYREVRVLRFSKDKKLVCLEWMNHTGLYNWAWGPVDAIEIVEKIEQPSIPIIKPGDRKLPEVKVDVR